jgi:uncharacterized protein (DUF1800 family)
MTTPICKAPVTSKLDIESLTHSGAATQKAVSSETQVQIVPEGITPGPSVAILSAAFLAACGGGDNAQIDSDSAPTDRSVTGLASGQEGLSGSAASAGAAQSASVTPNRSAKAGNGYPKANTDAEAARFLLQSQFSVSDSEMLAVRADSFASYLQKQFAKPLGPLGWDWLDTRGYSVANKYNYVYTAWPADFMLWSQIFSAPDAMRKRCALALSEFFVVSMQGTTASFLWRGHAFTQYWDLLVGNAFGNFRKLLEAVTLSAAMGYFLNTKGNQKEDGAGRQADENYAREVMQLFTIGLNKLNLNGTEQLDGNGKPIPTYALSDVTNLARVFTGYDLDNVQGRNSGDIFEGSGRLSLVRVDSKESVRRPMVLDDAKHSTLAASFLGATVPAGTKGVDALRTALDTLFNHPNVGPFFGKQMIQRLVTSNPSPAYVARVATAFNNNGAGVRGDLKAVWAAILLDDEARSPQGLVNPSFGKLREPILRFAQWGRTFGIKSAQGSWKVFDTSVSDRLGQAPLRAPSVFNFFRPGYVPPNTALAANKSPAPEFQMVNEISVCNYLNFMTIVINWQGLPVYDADKPNIDRAVETFDIKVDYSKELALSADAVKLIDRLNLLMCAGQLSAATRGVMVQALNSKPIGADSSIAERTSRVRAALFMVMAAPEYLIQK